MFPHSEEILLFCAAGAVFTMLSSRTMWTNRTSNATIVYSQRTIEKKQTEQGLAQSTGESSTFSFYTPQAGSNSDVLRVSPPC
jgi:hypothetical protein